MNLEWDKKLEESLEFINIGLTAREVTVFAWFTGLFFCVMSLIFAMAAVFLGINPLYVLLMGMVISCLFLFFVPQYPVRLVALEKMNCIGYAPRLVAYLIIPLKQDPNLEKAVKFAAESGDDKLTEDLKKLIWHTWSGKYNSVGEALPILGHKWGEHIKGFRDTFYAIRASQVEKSENRRIDTLNRALQELLNNINDSFKQFTNDLRIPTMVLFMGGVLIPMVVIMFLPVLSMMGFEIGTPPYVALILSGIIFGVFVVSEYVLARRPISFTPIEVPDNYPGLLSPGKIRVGEKECSLVKFSVGIAFFVSLLSVPYLLGMKIPVFDQLNTLPIVVGVYLGLWFYFWFDSMPRLKIKKALEKAEEDSIEACFHIGNRLLSGIPAEEALIRVSEMLAGQGSELSKILENTVRNVRYMNMELKDAFFDPDKGSLKDVHSGFIQGLFRLFANSMERGVDAAAETLLNSAAHFRDIRKVESSLREQVSYTTSMMKVSVVLIAPALCAISIPLTEVFIKILKKMDSTNSMIESTSTMTVTMLKPPALSPELLTLMLGAYMLLLLLILVRFTTILEYGNDGIRIKTEIAKALPQTLIVFVVVLFMVRLFFAQSVQ